ncbi:MAG: hypothetical protein QXK68_05180 [Saccharolobus sp.]
MLEEKLKQVYGIDKYGVNVPEWVDSIKIDFVKEIIGERLHEAKVWINNMNEVLNEAKEKLNIKGWLFSKEMASFTKDPLAHLVKKLFIYFHDLIRGRIDVNTFISKGRQAVNSSFGSNMRSIYQTWGFVSILLNLADYGFKIVYPEHHYLNFDRSGKQKSGIIPPNAIVENITGNSFSFFLEAPRPIAWEDGSDLEKVWKLYSTLRPDMMIYKGLVMNIVDLDNNQNIPIKRPNYIVEFKELENWWKRWRYLKGHKPLNGNEWRARWIKGLYKGLIDVLRELPKDLPEFKEDKGQRIKEYKIIELYRKVYDPDKSVVISRVKVDDEIKKELSNIIMLDDVGFNPRNFNVLVEDMIENVKTNFEIKELAYRFAIERKQEFIEWLKSHGFSNADIL